MVDGLLPIETRNRPLSCLFLDFNSYFASCEQQENPDLRDRPIAVCPVMADTSFVIAASYEAKAFGIKTGTMIREAKAMCPDLILVDARHRLYVGYHQRILEIAESVLPIDEVCSVDEMRFSLIGEERNEANAIEIAKKMKRTIREKVGDYMRCSVGIAPNPFLAKVATELQKPDGLVVLKAEDLPHRLHALKLTDFPGINWRMKARLNANGIFTTEQMCAAPKDHMLRAFGSVIGERWWFLLRGYDLGREATKRSSLGHSHVLPPNLRNDQGCREVMLRLLQKASARLRSEDLWAGAMTVYVGGFKRSWHARTRLPATQDTMTLNEHFLELWRKADYDSPRMVGVTFDELRTETEFTPSLFTPTKDRAKLSHAVDRVNKKFGKHSVYLAGMEKVRHTADEKIAFNKTWLFSEGKDDNVYINPFNGAQTAVMT